MEKKSLFAVPESSLSDEFFENLLKGKEFKIERIVSKGHITEPGTWLDQDFDEWVILFQGAAKLKLFDLNEELSMLPGDYILIPARTKHRVTWTDDNQLTYWLAIHFKAEGLD